VWHPPLFVFPSTKDAPRIALAALQAEAFLVLPKLELRRIARRIARKLGLGRLKRRLRGGSLGRDPGRVPGQGGTGGRAAPP